MMSVRKSLKKFPLFEKVLRRTFLYAKYFIKGNLKFTYQIHKATLKSICSDTGGATFFGYYDKSPWSASGNSYLTHRLQGNSCSITLSNPNEDKTVVIAETIAWNYQQGAMLQWLPNAFGNRVVFNDVLNNILGSRIYDLSNGKSEFFEWPVQAIHPNGLSAISLNYCRLRVVNSEYGYLGNYKNLHENLSNDKDGLWSFSLVNSDSTLLVSIADLINHEKRATMGNAVHCINHVMYSPSGDNIIFLHRWVTNDHVRYSRLYLLNEKSNELKILLDEDFVSHYCWLDDNKVFTYSGNHKTGKAYYFIEINTGKVTLYNNDDLNSHGDGHPGLSPDGNWIVTDTYPDDARVRTLLLVNLKNNEIHEVGKFFSPVSFEDAKRCDLHPRWHPEKPEISIDSAHEGGRKSYILNVSKITGLFKNDD